MPTWGEALAWGINEINSNSDCLRLMTDRTQLNLLDVYSLADKPYPGFEQFKQDIARRKRGEPVAYITERQDFWQHQFYVNDNVLIPRSDSEVILEAILKINPVKTILELGVGSGALIISYLLASTVVSGYGSDISKAALEVAARNSQNLKCKNLELRHGNWFNPWQGYKFDLVIANPPYIAADDEHLADLSFEPAQALISGQNGFADLWHIIDNAHHYINKMGWLVLEHGYLQADNIKLRFNQKHWHNIRCIVDINGNERVTIAQVL